MRVVTASGHEIEVEGDSSEIGPLLREALSTVELDRPIISSEPVSTREPLPQPKTTPQSSQEETPRAKTTDPALERQARAATFEAIKKRAPDAHHEDRARWKRVWANDNLGIVNVSTHAPGPQGYWFGFRRSWLHEECPMAILAVLADRAMTFVIPYDETKPIFDECSLDKKGKVHFYIRERSGRFYLKGAGTPAEADVSAYENAFSFFA